MTLHGDEKKWYFSSDGQLYDIAKEWAKKFTYKELRAFQQSYADYQRMPNASEERKIAYDHMWQTATWAIDIQVFGK
jgi:hypothetical protein